jgi:hypothetical protein
MVSINHEKNIIYFHIPKTGGTYIQTILNDYYDFTSYNKLIRPDFEIFNKYNKFKINSLKDYSRINPYCNRLFGVNNYFSGSEETINMTTLDKKKWKEAYKFTFVRNPYTRFISSWNYILSTPAISENLIDNDTYSKFENLEYFIDHRDELSDIAYNHVFLMQYEQIINSEGINDMDYIGKQENLEDNLKEVLNKVGFRDINHIRNEGINKNKIDYNYYKTYYTEEVFNFVNIFFEKDFDEFGYKRFDKYEDFLNSK